jgi:hypothetical protein
VEQVIFRKFLLKFRYSPKIYDGHFLQTHQDWFKKRLKHTRIVADQHFRWGVENFKGTVTFHVAPAKPSKKSKTTLTKRQQKYRTDVLFIRHRVENPFGRLSTKFDALKTPFGEGQKQQEYLVTFVCGICNAEIH